MSREDYLFIRADWFGVERSQRHHLREELDSIPPDRLLNTSVDDLAKYLTEKYRVDVPILDVGNVTVDEHETQIDVSRDPMRMIIDRSHPVFIKATEVSVEIPFSGDGNALYIKPTTSDMNPPRARVHGNLIVFSVTGTNLAADAVRKEIDSVIASIEKYLGYLRTNAAALNEQLPGEATAAIEARRAKLLASRNMVSALGFKMKERPNAPKTYNAPEVRRKIAPVLPAAASTPYKPEPWLSLEDYEHILGVMQNMAIVMERSPSAFLSIDEEGLRSHFLVQLNGHYQGQASAETFNYQGKTDILIRSQGRNIFIAECKYWSGPKALSETIDQILGYLSWRDTKAAIVLFNRNRDFSRVLEAIPGTVRNHPQFKREVGGSSETVFRYKFANQDDPNRELTLTILAFDVPTPSPARSP